MTKIKPSSSTLVIAVVVLLHVVLLPVLLPVFYARLSEVVRASNERLFILAVFSGGSLSLALYFGLRITRPDRGTRDLPVDLDHVRHRQRLETIGTLTGGIAHEFNNALLPIILFTEAALEDLPQDSPTREDLSRVLGSARRARAVVRRILTFSHRFDGANLAVVDLRAATVESFELFAVLVPRAVRLTSELDPWPTPVRADAALLQQLVMNLCVNAYQSLGKNGGEVTIGLRRAAGEAELWVRDDGHGMDEAVVARIFEPFFTTRGVGTGTGLGLSVVHGIVESFGARIAVETADGAGTTIRVFFPIVEDPA